jgi:hypothetical protein
MTQFAMESIRSVLEGELNLALVMAPRQGAQITAVPFTPLRSTLHFQRPTRLPTRNAR